MSSMNLCNFLSYLSSNNLYFTLLKVLKFVTEYSHQDYLTATLLDQDARRLDSLSPFLYICVIQMVSGHNILAANI